MSPAQRANILNHLSQINHPGFAGDRIRNFVQSAHNKTDDEVIECITELQSQIHDNRGGMRATIGSQFYFFSTLKIPQHESCHQP